MNKNQIKDLYQEYIATVMPADFSNSLESTFFILDKIEKCKPKLVVDFGCGFSTVALHLNKDIKTMTLSDDQVYWDKTLEFLVNKNIYPIPVYWNDRNREFVIPKAPYFLANLYQKKTLNELKEVTSYDFGVYKFSSDYQKRVSNFKYAYNLLENDGHLYIDDFHSENYKKTIQSSVQEPIDFLSIQTRDDFGRFWWNFTKKEDLKCWKVYYQRVRLDIENLYLENNYYYLRKMI